MDYDKEEPEFIISVFKEDKELIFVESSVGDSNKIYQVLIIIKCKHRPLYFHSPEETDDEMEFGVDLNCV